jgi:hypothetical protein
MNDADIRLLAETDELHGTLSGPATKKLCERLHVLFGESGYERLAGISIAHLYNLRQYRVTLTARPETAQIASRPALFSWRVHRPLLAARRIRRPAFYR